MSEKIDRIFIAFANKYRRDIVHRLSLQPASISQLAHESGLSLPAIHKHIKLLEQSNAVRRKKSGQCNFLALDRRALLDLKKWTNQYHTYWGTQGETLKNYVARIERDRLKLDKRGGKK